MGRVGRRIVGEVGRASDVRSGDVVGRNGKGGGGGEGGGVEGGVVAVVVAASSSSSASAPIPG